jgi:hypothetical protein
MIRRLFQWRNLWRLVKWGCLTGLAVALVSVAAFLLVARTKQRNFQPVTTAVELDAHAVASLPGYQRAEDATYLTFPEWYLVFQPQEYAQYIALNRPSGFPYGRSIAQMWGGYAEVYGIARQHYPFNAGYNVMLVVICSSSTVEFAIKGAYENTVGRVFEWTASAQTPEDKFAAEVAREYGAFIPFKPWFEYPFGAKFKELWTAHDFFGPDFLRKCERKFFLSLEYGIKALYARAIGAASASAYGTAATQVVATLRDPEGATRDRTDTARVQELAGDNRWIVKLPHYQGFTDTVPALARHGVNFEEIAGNDEIMLTLHAPAGWSYNLSAGKPLFTMALLTGDARQRVAVQVPVRDLGNVLRELDGQGLRVEHLFDY